MLTLKAFLRHEVKPALGCTEPAAVALAVARACRELGQPGQVTWVKVDVSDSIFKNGMAVGIPGANGAKGNAMAAALAVIRGNPDYGLEVLKDCRPADVEVAARWVDEGKVQVECLPEVHGVFVEAVVAADGHQAACTIADYHSNIVRVVKDGQTLPSRAARDGAEPLPVTDLLELVAQLSYPELLALAGELDDEDVEYLWRGIDMNRAIADYGLRGDVDCGLCVGRTLASLMEHGELKDDLGYEVKSYCCAASDARMAGAQMPVMSSAGSGNHGITAILPIALLGEKLGKSRKEIAQAIAVSHLVTSLVKSKTGRLSPICGCAAAAGAGATAGLTYLQGGTPEQIAMAAQTLLASTAGMICDGAKESCSLKVGTAAAEAYLASILSLRGVGVDSPQGVVDASLEQTTDNIGRLNRDGMKDVDQVLIEILSERSGPRQWGNDRRDPAAPRAS